MNVIFLDFDGVLNTYHYNKIEDVERRIVILADICHEYNCKVVIEASMKDAIDEETMETDNIWIKQIFRLFQKYHIDCIGRTPVITKWLDENKYISFWKEDEILLYLANHPEIEHYCIIDDDSPINSDLDKVRDHLVQTIDYSNNPEEEGLLARHKEEVGCILKKDNKQLRR